MIESMTGYGSAECASPNYKVSVELKSLNNKYFEVTLKLPRVYLRFEHKMRNELSQRLRRGKVMGMINVEVLSGEKRTLNLNRALARRYLSELQELADYLEIERKVDLPFLLELPEVIPTESEQEDPEEWALMEEALREASEKLILSRMEEGQALDADLEGRVTAIAHALQQISELAPSRIENVRARIDQTLEDIRHKVTELDPNRFEQELIFYMEKLDINEEIVRLTQHLEFFTQLRQAEESNGKQMQFISQEMGREINTIGSKANDATIQRLVVAMKDELERIKEQVLNIV